MASTGFQFQQFFVRHDRCAMRVGTDGVLLGAWARIPTLQPTEILCPKDLFPSEKDHIHINLPISGTSKQSVADIVKQPASDISRQPSEQSSGYIRTNSHSLQQFPQKNTLSSTPHILDIGTGTGLVALMMAQRFPIALIEAREIEPDAAAQAALNFKNCAWSNRLTIIPQSIQDFIKENYTISDNQKTLELLTEHPAKTPILYDAITCNPPFFVDSLKCPDDHRTLARHSDTLSPHDLMTAAKSLLKPWGELSIIIPTDIISKYEAEAAFSGLLLTRITTIRTVARKMPKRALLAFSPTRLLRTDINEQTLMNADNSRSQWYQQLTKDFYIK